MPQLKPKRNTPKPNKKFSFLQKGDQHYSVELARQQLKIAELETKAYQLNGELRQQQSPRGQLKNLYRTVDLKIMRAIDRRGYAVSRRTPTVPFPRIEISEQPREKLLKLAREHDANKYFHYKPARATMKFRYRLASKAYRTTRDISKKAVRGGYRLIRSRPVNAAND